LIAPGSFNSDPGVIRNPCLTPLMRQLIQLTSCVCLMASASLSWGADSTLLWYDKPAT